MGARAVRHASAAILVGIFIGVPQLMLAPRAVARSGRCGRLCAVSDDHMVYRVTSYFTFRAPAGEVETAVGYKITNRSHRAHVFAPLPGGFTAVTTSGQYEQVTDYQPGRKGCYVSNGIAPPYLHQDPDQYRIRPGHTRVMKLMCMIVPSGERLAKVQFADNDAYRNAVVKLPRVANLRPKAHRKKRGSGPKNHKQNWWLPNPCQVTPQRYMIDPRSEYTLSWGGRGTSQARALCQHTDYGPVWANHRESFYIGYVPPLQPSGSATTTSIAGWPGATLTISTRDYFNDPYWFWTVNFHRRFDGHVVYGQYWYAGESCTSSEPHAAIVVKALYDAFGPPGVSVPPRYPLPSPCYAPPSSVSIGTSTVCPAGSLTPCQASAKLTATVISRGRHPVAAAARADRRVRHTVVIGSVSVEVQPGHRVIVNVELNAKGRRLLLIIHRLRAHVLVKVTQGHRRVRVLRRKLRIKARRIARR